MTDRFWRQIDIVPITVLSKIPVTVIGAGGIGGTTCLALCKMGIQNLTVYDNDVIELHNLPNQPYRISDIGKPKVEALAEICFDFSGVKIKAIPEKFEKQQITHGIVISAVDSMSQRKIIWEAVRRKVMIDLYIEGRMGAQMARIYSFAAHNPALGLRYETEMLYSDDQALKLPCTAQAIIYNTQMIASLISHQITEHANGRPVPWETLFDFVTHSFIVS